MGTKDFREMTNDELCRELIEWEKRVEQSSGWSSAYFAATCLRMIVSIGNERGLGFINKFPIIRAKHAS